MTKAETDALRADFQNLRTDLAERLGRIETLLATAPERCPYREDIARGQNNVRRLGDLERTVQEHRLETTKAAAAGGSVVAVAMLALQFLGKAMGWL